MLVIRKTKFIPYLFITIFLTLGLSIAFQSLLAQWIAPTAAPPLGNADKPINVSGEAQIKSGDLYLLNDFSVDINTLYVNSASRGVGIGTTDPSAELEIGNIPSIGITDVFKIERSGGVELYTIQYDHTASPSDINFRSNTKNLHFQNRAGFLDSLVIESDGDVSIPNVFFADQANDRVGIGTTQPGATLYVAGSTNFSPINYVYNGSFENNTASGWNPGGSSFDVSATQSYSGSYSLRIYNMSGWDWRAITYSIANPAKFIGKRLSFSLWMRGDSTNFLNSDYRTGYPHFGTNADAFAWSTTNGSNADGFTSSRLLDNNWYRYTGSFIVPAGTTNLYFSIPIWMGQNPNSYNTPFTGIYIDNVTVTEGAALKYSPIAKDDYDNILISGNVGIGTTDPGTKLEVLTTYGDKLKLTSSDNNRSLIFGHNASESYLTVSSGDNFKINNAAGTPFFIQNSGNVGIGITNPGQKLDVGGNIELNGALVGGISSARVFYDLVANRWAGAQTGALVIQTNVPQDDHTMTQTKIKIKRVFSNGDTNCEYLISGYWSTEGNGGFSGRGYVANCNDLLRVRFMRNNATGDVVIVLGETTTSWNHPMVAVTEFLAHYNIATDAYADGWTAAITNDLSGYINSDDVSNTKPIVDGSGIANYIPKWSDSDTFTNSIIYDNGSVGIGTTQPGEKLHVVGGDAHFADKIKLGTGGYSYIEHDDASLITFYQSNWGGDFKFRAADMGGTSYDRVFIEGSTGNVGVGTTDPGSKLEVYDGDIEMTQGKSIAVNTNNNAGIFLGNYNGDPTFCYLGDSSANCTNEGSQYAAGIFVEGSVKAGEFCIGDFDCQGTWGDIVLAGGGGLWATTTDSSGIYPTVVGWNVGIGTTDPGAKLDVLGEIQVTDGIRGIQFESESANRRLKVIIDNPGGPGSGYTFATPGWSNDYFEIVSNPATEVPIAKFTSNGDSWLAANGGNVGIGTTQPGANLDVSGTGRFTDTLTLSKSSGNLLTSSDSGVQTIALTNDSITGVNTITINDTGSGEGISWGSQNISVYTSGQGGYDAFVFNTSGAYPFVFNTGNVGIGATNPGYKLDIRDSGSTAVVRVENDSATLRWTGLRLDRDNLSEKWFLGMNEDNDYLRFRRSGSIDDMVIDTSGNVGIGLTNPGDKLVVQGGDIDVRADTPRVRVTDTGESNKYIELRYEGGWGRLYTDGSNIYTNRMFRADAGLRVGDDEGFYRSAEDVVRTGDSFIVDGNVGIGTTDPGSKLEVYDGNIEMTDARSIVVNRNPRSGLFFGNYEDGKGFCYENDSLNSPACGSPSYPIDLYVEGSVKASDICFGNTDCKDSWEAMGVFWEGALAGDIYNINTGNIGIGTTDPLGKLVVNANGSDNFIVESDGDVSIPNVFFADQANDRVGIGTTNPGASLDLGGTTGIGPVTQLHLGGLVNQGFNLGTKLSIDGYDNEASMEIIKATDENGNVDFLLTSAPGSTANPTMYFRGNVGIGTTDPSYTLDIAGVVGERIWRGTGYAPLVLRSDGDGTHNNGIYEIYSYGSGGSNDINFSTANWGGEAYFDWGSGVGQWHAVRIIGTGAGAATKGYGILDVYNNDTVTIRLQSSGDSYFNAGNVGFDNQ